MLRTKKKREMSDMKSTTAKMKNKKNFKIKLKIYLRKLRLKEMKHRKEKINKLEIVQEMKHVKNF